MRLPQFRPPTALRDTALVLAEENELVQNRVCCTPETSEWHACNGGTRLLTSIAGRISASNVAYLLSRFATRLALPCLTLPHR